MRIGDYDKEDRTAIFNYSKSLVGNSLRDFVTVAPEYRGKGGLGQLVEELFFGYEINANPEADFASAGVELKCTPLKLTHEGELTIKERLVCGLINYREDWDKPFEESHFYRKCLVMLILFYLHQGGGISRLDLKFLFTVLWQLPEKDLLIMRHDYEVIIDKIKNGQAHTLSEGDTMYLGACRKGQKGDSLMPQHGSDIGAPRRAWCLKMAYMRTVLEETRKKHQDGAYTNIAVQSGKKETEQMVRAEDLRQSSFDDIILARFVPYMGKDFVEFCRMTGHETTYSKQLYFVMANAIAGNRRVGNVNRSEEFLKAGLTMKTVRVQHNGWIKESMSFENIDYQEVYDCENWFDSRLYELFSARFLFVVFKETDGRITLPDGHEENRYVLDDVFFWTMPQADLEVAREYWENIRRCVLRNTISPEFFWKISDKKRFHVRPKGRNALDMTGNPHGGTSRKYCYWFNSEYVTDIISKHK